MVKVQPPLRHQSRVSSGAEPILYAATGFRRASTTFPRVVTKEAGSDGIPGRTR